jgi:hypothetical protein
MKEIGKLEVGTNIPVDNTVEGIVLEKAQVDCSQLFEEVDISDSQKKKYILKQNPNGILDLSSPLSALFQNREQFLPSSLFVRDCMNDIFDGVMRAPLMKRCVVFGSPGVGKSVLTFLAVLCYASLGKEPTLFMRKTGQYSESISVFWAAANENGLVDVFFTRTLERTASLDYVAYAMYSWGLTESEDEEQDPVIYVRTFCDGPKITDKGDQGGESASLVTSGGLERPHGENVNLYFLFPVSAWSLEEIVAGLRAMAYKRNKSEIKEIYDVMGGKIRDVLDALNSPESLDQNLQRRRNELEEIVKKDLTEKQIKVAIVSTELSGTKDNKDRVRAMFAKNNGYMAGFPTYETVQFLGSKYLARLLQSKLSLKDIIKALVYAKNSGIQSLYGWHFELFGHKILQVWSEARRKLSEDTSMSQPQNLLNFNICLGIGRGKESVSSLTKSLLYWMPSIPNFANIDAAFVLNGGALYCIQYTVSTEHAFNCKTFMSDFFLLIPASFRDSITAVNVVFVVPDEVTFKTVRIPAAQEDLFPAKGEHLTIAYKKKKIEKNTNSKDEASVGDGEDDDNNYDDDDDAMDIQGQDQDETQDLPVIHFRWEQRSLEYFDTQLPLSFLD